MTTPTISVFKTQVENLAQEYAQKFIEEPFEFVEGNLVDVSKFVLSETCLFKKDQNQITWVHYPILFETWDDRTSQYILLTSGVEVQSSFEEDLKLHTLKLVVNFMWNEKAYNVLLMNYSWYDENNRVMEHIEQCLFDRYQSLLEVFVS